jgi:hypothetical protein
MPHRTLAGRVLIVVVAASAVVLLWSTSVLSDATRAIDNPHPQTIIEQESSMVSFQKSWESAECGTVTVLTVCGIDYNGNPIRGGETLEQCISRHRATVARLMDECPPA